MQQSDLLDCLKNAPTFTVILYEVGIQTRRKLPEKGQMLTFLGFAGQVVSVATTQLHCPAKAAINDM